MNRKIMNQKGMTLIEILAAMVILGLVIISFMSITNYTSLADYRSGQKAEAMRIAEETLNELRNEVTSADLIGSHNANYIQDVYTIDVTDLPLQDTSPGDYPSTNKRVTVHAVVLMTNGSELETRLLTVTVSWGA